MLKSYRLICLWTSETLFMWGQTIIYISPNVIQCTDIGEWISNVWWCPTHLMLCFLFCFVCLRFVSCVQQILCCVFCLFVFVLCLVFNRYCVVFFVCLSSSCVLCSTDIVLCFLFVCFRLCLVFNSYCVVFFVCFFLSCVLCVVLYVGHHHTQDTRRRQIKQNTISGEHKTLRRRHKKNPTQYVLNTTIHKTQDEDKQTKNTTQYQ
jgi:hypothetical protein